MIKINLLPHREERRKQRRNDFYTLLVFASIVAVLILLLVGFYNASQISLQNQQNHLIKSANDKLDEEIKEIATLREEIDGLKARQQAVEDLQGDRNQPVYLLSELVAQTPEGIYLRSVKQDGQHIVLTGYAQSNERVSEYLKNLGSHSDWLNKPDLIVINATGIGQGKDAKKVFDFTVNVAIKRPRDQEAAGAATATPAIAPANGQAVKP
ncbi:PilN domain-containing protein [Solimicrobium silvestre]|uniref:Tfp pilus assembly protein PilN n=1 Tax=Solimicrobium silvestre TaxID=2099400 RepID=A0A2S9H482_9BURK|nr:PilN domain-containing protein [Solimicrobium silvestre]PRC94780.1 Tfp pilus assembly protein PilN [Solimicrobium silvestre]